MTGPLYGSVWSSTTGEHWSKQALTAVIPRQMPEAAVGFKDRLWVIGDEAQLWSSKDGFDWVEEMSPDAQRQSRCSASPARNSSYLAIA